jgi:hypothetical protein
MMNNREIAETLAFLFPNKEWFLDGDNYENLIWLSEGNKPTLAELEAEFLLLPNKKAEAETQKATEKAALLAKLGITDDEAKLLLS